jgi:hypothetical protein
LGADPPTTANNKQQTAKRLPESPAHDGAFRRASDGFGETGSLEDWLEAMERLIRREWALRGIDGVSPDQPRAVLLRQRNRGIEQLR